MSSFLTQVHRLMGSVSGCSLTDSCMAHPAPDSHEDPAALTALSLSLGVVALQGCGGGARRWSGFILVAGFPTTTVPKLQRGILASWLLARAQSRHKICCFHCQLEELCQLSCCVEAVRMWGRGAVAFVLS